MFYADVGGKRQPPLPKLTGACCRCGEKVLSKCGAIKVWHWAHASKKHCDPWWENETEWHRNWKSLYPERFREIIHEDPATSEKHIADIKNDGGLVIEFQNSPMSVPERNSREGFYGDMVWVINGKNVQSGFRIMDRLPDPLSDFAKDLVFFPGNPNGHEGTFWRRSENPENPTMVRIHSLREIKEGIDEHYRGHHLFHWQREKEIWLTAKRPIYFDFGEPTLWHLQVLDEARGIKCVQEVSKIDFLKITEGHVIHCS
jgi:competence protein CoiA